MWEKWQWALLMRSAIQLTTVCSLQLFKKRSEKQDIEELQLMIEELDRANFIITEFCPQKIKTIANEVDINHIIKSIYPFG